MRIWQCTRLNTNGVGGVEKHIYEVSEELKKLGHELHIGPELPKSWDKEAGIIAHTHGDRWPNPIRLRQLKWIHVCHGTSIGRVVACREFLSVSGWRGCVRDFYPTQFATAAVAVGEQALKEARKYFKMTLPAIVIPNGANATTFMPLRQLTTDQRLIYLGRSDDRVKNVPSLLRACALAHVQMPGLQLWAAPGIDYDYEVHPFVKNLGPLHGSELAAALAQCRALILCSFYEGDPIVLREAQAMGLPIIASDIPQIRTSLRDYPNATFVNPRNPENIAGGIKAALSGITPVPSPRLRGWDQVAREFESFYKSQSGEKT